MVPCTHTDCYFATYVPCAVVSIKCLGLEPCIIHPEPVLAEMLAKRDNRMGGGGGGGGVLQTSG